MWGRFEGLVIVILFAALSNAAGQSSLPEGAIRILEAEAERGGADMEELVAYCEMLLAHPLDLNSASEEELYAFPLLTPFQIASLLEYRESFGAILSEGELALVDGFSLQKVESLRPFI